jgi:polar amino acid transport system substrate-binding protein
MIDGRRLFLSTLALSLALALAPTRELFCSSLADVKQRGELLMLCFPHESNQFITVRNGEYWGLDYEILRTFATAQGIAMKVVAVPEFADLIPWLLEGKGDVIGSSFSITEERKKKVDFSDGYFPVRIMVVGREGAELTDVSALSSKKMAAVPGSSLETLVRSRVPSVQIVPVEETPDAYRSVASGAADYAPVDSTSAMTDLPNFPGLAVRFTFPDRMGYGFAVTRGSDLAAALSEHIRRLRSSGLLYQQLGRYLGPRAVEMVKAAEAGK